MTFLQNALMQTIKHQFYRSLTIFIVAIITIFFMIPQGFVQDHGITSMKRLFSGEIGQPEQQFQFQKITQLETNTDQPSQYLYYLAENDGNQRIIKTSAKEVKIFKNITNQNSALLQGAGQIAEAFGEGLDKPKVTFIGKLMNNSGKAIEKYTLSFYGHYAKVDSSFISDEDRIIFNKLQYNKPIIVSTGIYKIPNVFWLLPLAVLLFMIDGIYLFIQAKNPLRYLINSASQENTDVSLDEILTSFTQAESQQQLTIIPEGAYTHDYLFIQKLTKFHCIKFSEILIFSEQSGEILLKRLKYPLRPKLSQSSILQIAQYIQVNFPQDILTEHQKIQPFREENKVESYSIWGDIWRSLWIKFAVLMIGFIITTLFLLPGISLSTFIILLIIIAILSAFSS